MDLLLKVNQSFPYPDAFITNACIAQTLVTQIYTASCPQNAK